MALLRLPHLQRQKWNGREKGAEDGRERGVKAKVDGMKVDENRTRIALRARLHRPPPATATVGGAMTGRVATAIAGIAAGPG